MGWSGVSLTFQEQEDLALEPHNGLSKPFPQDYTDQD